MKKFVLTLISLLTIATASQVKAQSFTILNDTVKAVLKDAGGKATTYIDNKTTSSLTLNWKVVAHNIPPSPSKWFTSFGICDNNLCYSSDLITMPYPTKTFNPIAASAVNISFYMSFGDLAGAANGPYYVSVEVTDGSTTTDTVTFIVNKWTTSVNNTTAKNDNVVVYPNPAHDELNVLFNNIPDVKTLTVVNMIGKVVDVYKVNTNSAKINIENIPSGVYILRLTDSQGHVVVTRKFTHQ